MFEYSTPLQLSSDVKQQVLLYGISLEQAEANQWLKRRWSSGSTATKEYSWMMDDLIKANI